jgi:hypothetical protein
MALNSNRINGFSPHSYLNGAPYNGQARLYAIPVSDTSASYAIGDVVQSAGGSDPDGIIYIKKAVAGLNAAGAVLGVIVGIRVANPGVSLQGVNLGLETNYITAGTRTSIEYVYVADDPQILFEVSAGLTATNITLAKMRYNAGLGSFYSGADQTYAIDQNASVTTLSQSSPYSNVIVPSSTVAVTASLPLSIMGLVQRADNPGTNVGAYSRLLVKFNFHELGATAQVGAAATNFLGL